MGQAGAYHATWSAYCTKTVNLTRSSVNRTPKKRIYVNVKHAAKKQIHKQKRKNDFDYIHIHIHFQISFLNLVVSNFVWTTTTKKNSKNGNVSVRIGTISFCWCQWYASMYRKMKTTKSTYTQTHTHVLCVITSTFDIACNFRAVHSFVQAYTLWNKKLIKW